MNPQPTSSQPDPCRPLFDASRHPALWVGAFLGWMAWEMSRVPERPSYNLVMALVMLAAGSASYVMRAVHLRSLRPRATRSAMLNEARASMVWLGSGIAAAMVGLPLL